MGRTETIAVHGTALLAALALAGLVHASDAPQNPPVTGQTLTVGPGGDYPTIAAAIADARIGDGSQESQRDQIVILDGDYISGQIEIACGKRYLTIRSRNPDKVKIALAKGLLFKAASVDHITIAGLRCGGGTGFGWFQFCHDIVLEDIRYTGGQFGVRFGGGPGNPVGAGGHSHRIANSWFCNNGKEPDGGHTGIEVRNTSAKSWAQRTLIEACKLNGNGEDGVQTAGAVDNHRADEEHVAAYIEIRNCEMKDNGENGADLKASRCIRFHHNIVTGNKDPGVVAHSPENDGKSTGTFLCAIYNNWIADNGGIGYAQPDGDVGAGTRNLIFNNIVLRNRFAGIWTGECELNRGDRIFCNTVVGTTGQGANAYRGGWGIAIGGGEDNRVIANIVHRNSHPGFPAGSKSAMAGNIVEEPGFAKAEAEDYRLAGDSPVLARRLADRLFTAKELERYRANLGDDLPITERGPSVYYDGAPRSGDLVPGALGPAPK